MSDARIWRMKPAGQIKPPRRCDPNGRAPDRISWERVKRDE